MFNRPPTPSTARDMADRVVGRQRNPIPLFLCHRWSGEKKKKGQGCPGNTTIWGQTHNFFAKRQEKSRAMSGGVNPGTPMYVGDLCIILHHQKHTSSIFPAAKKNYGVIHMYFFWQEPNTCARRAAQRHGQNQNFSSVLSELFLHVFGNPCHEAAREQS